MKKILLLVLVGISTLATAQHSSVLPADYWVDSVFKTLSKDQKIAQLMVVRVSSIGPNRTAIFFEKEVEEAILKYNVGSL